MLCKPVDDRWNITTRPQSESEYQCSTFRFRSNLLIRSNILSLCVQPWPVSYASNTVIGHLFYNCEWMAFIFFRDFFFFSFLDTHLWMNFISLVASALVLHWNAPGSYRCQFYFFIVGIGSHTRAHYRYSTFSTYLLFLFIRHPWKGCKIQKVNFRTQTLFERPIEIETWIKHQLFSNRYWHYVCTSIERCAIAIAIAIAC